MIVRRPSSLFPSNRLAEIQNAQQKTINRLATAKRIESAADDAAGLAIATSLESTTRGLSGQIGNRQSEISMLQTAEGAMGEISTVLGRMHELSVQAANGTLSDGDRQAVQREIEELRQQIAQTVTNTEFNTKKVFDGSISVQLQNGLTFPLPRLDPVALGIDSMDVSTVSGAQAGIGSAKTAIDRVSSARSSLGATQNGIASDLAGLQQQLVDSTAALSRIADADMAKEAVELSKQQVQAQAATNVFRTDAKQAGRVLQLLAA